MNNFLRLCLTPPAGDIPSAGFIDIFYDAANGTIATRDKDGDIVSILRSTSIPDITDAATPATIAKRTISGGLNCVTLGADKVLAGSEGVEVTPPAGVTPSSATGLTSSSLVLVDATSDKTFSVIISSNTLSADRVAYMGDAAGVVPVLPAYTDLTAANTALAAGVYYWDLTLKRLMVTTA